MHGIAWLSAPNHTFVAWPIARLSRGEKRSSRDHGTRHNVRSFSRSTVHLLDQQFGLGDPLRSVALPTKTRCRNVQCRHSLICSRFRFRSTFGEDSCGHQIAARKPPDCPFRTRPDHSCRNGGTILGPCRPHPAGCHTGACTRMAKTTACSSPAGSHDGARKLARCKHLVSSGGPGEARAWPGIRVTLWYGACCLTGCPGHGQLVIASIAYFVHREGLPSCCNDPIDRSSISARGVGIFLAAPGCGMACQLSRWRRSASGETRAVARWLERGTPSASSCCGSGPSGSTGVPYVRRRLRDTCAVATAGASSAESSTGSGGARCDDSCIPFKPSFS